MNRKYLVLKGLDYRADKYGKNDVVELEQGLANKLVSVGEVRLATDAEIESYAKKIAAKKAKTKVK